MAEHFLVPKWAIGANIYEVNVRQYTREGTFAAFGKALPRLKEMGVQILWFMPITPISKERRQGTLGSYYACSNYTAINPEFGTLNDFKALVEQAHNLGLKVIIDWVANHTGWDHVWTTDHPEFYKKDEDGNFYDANGWVDVIDLNYEVEGLRKEMINCMKFWLDECKIDGFRCDMAHLIPLDFWMEARTALDKPGNLFWLAETEEPSYHQVFDASYAWEFLHTTEAIYKGEKNVQGLRKVLNRYNLEFPSQALRAYFTTNHDENSHSGSEYERLGASAKTFAVLCATLPNSIPLVYSGQELPNTKRLLFFDKDEIDWSGQYELHNFYKILLENRKNNPAFNGTYKELRTTSEDNVFAFTWSFKEKHLLVLMNLSSVSYLKFTVDSEVLTGRYRNVFTGIELDITTNNFELQAWEYLLYETD